jgi:hypothetical protein
LLVKPAPPLVDEMMPVVFETVPCAEPVTAIEIVQEPAAAIVPLPRESEVLFAVAPITDPPQLLTRPGVLAT